MLRDDRRAYTRSIRAWCAGLDYYSRTVFEWITDVHGAQNAVCSGGRYDGLIAQLGGEPTPGDRFRHGRGAGRDAAGAGGAAPRRPRPDVYVVVSGDRGGRAGPGLVERLRDELPHRRFEMNLGGGNFKAQFRRADRSAGRWR